MNFRSHSQRSAMLDHVLQLSNVSGPGVLEEALSRRDREAASLGLLLLTHLDEEEAALFPALTASNPDRAALVQPLASMLAEHRAVAVLLERVRSAAEEFALPDWACNSYRTLFAELQQLEGDVLRHVHLENHVLKPRFAAG